MRFFTKINKNDYSIYSVLHYPINTPLEQKRNLFLHNAAIYRNLSDNHLILVIHCYSGSGCPTEWSMYDVALFRSSLKVSFQPLPIYADISPAENDYVLVSE